MDRRFEITLDGKLYAELQFKYAAAGNGEVIITTYKTEEVKTEEGLPLPVPVPDKRYLKTFSHDPMHSITEIMAYDISFCRDEFNETLKAEELLPFYHSRIEQVRFRLLRDGGMAGIINIAFNFPENAKELTFLSVFRIKEDIRLSADSLECNMELVKRLIRENPHSFSASEIELKEVS